MDAYDGASESARLTDLYATWQAYISVAIMPTRAIGYRILEPHSAGFSYSGGTCAGEVSLLRVPCTNQESLNVSA